MKHYKDAIIHGAQLFRHLKGQETFDSELALAKLPLAVARTSARALSWRAATEEEVEEGDDFFSSFALGEDESEDDFFDDFFSSFDLGEDEWGDDFFSAFLGGGNDEPEGGDGEVFSDFALGFGGDDDDLDKFMENFEQCGIDIQDMATKALGAYFLYGSDFDLSSPESFLGSDAYGPILLALKDDDEKECSATESAQLLLASEEYLQCSGINDIWDPKETEVLFQSIEYDCKPVFDMVTTGDLLSLQQDVLDEESAFGESSKRCLQTLLGDNAMGNFIRYEYNHIDKIYGCFSKLGENLPHCVLSLPVQDGDSVPLPISLEKKLACVLGSSYQSFIEEACVDMYEGLDKCLPQSDDDTDVDDTTSSCAGEEGILIGKQDDLLGMDASVVTGNGMPDFCSKIFEEKGMNTEELQSRLEHYNKNREYGWTIESIVNDAKDEVEAVTESTEGALVVSSQVSGQSQALYKSKPFVISSEEYSTWTGGDAAPDDDISSQKEYFPFLVAGLVIAAAVLLSLIVKYRGFGAIPVRSHSTSDNTSRKDYVNIC